MNTNKKNIGQLIAHFTRKATEDDFAAVREIVSRAIAETGMPCTFTLKEKQRFVCDSLGYPPIVATIKVKNAVPVIRTANGKLVKGMDTITVSFARKSGLFDFNEYGERVRKENELYESLPVEKAKEEISKLHWDADIVDYHASTNGKAKDYRCRRWYIYEGGTYGYVGMKKGGHFGYAEDWNELATVFRDYLYEVAVELGYLGKAKEVA